MSEIKTPQEIATALATLAEATPPDEVKQRPGNKLHQGPCDKPCRQPHAMLDYVDARFVQQRLDMIGPENWQSELQVVNGGAICRIGIKLGGEWIWKTDGGDPSDIEGFKGQLSDAFKRAAVLWGVSRDLYEDRRASKGSQPASAPRSAPRASQAPARPAQTDREGTPLDVCPVHRERWQHKVGTSKAGTAYDFWGCPSKEGGTFCRERPDKAFLDGIAEAVADELGDDLANIPF